MSGIKQAIENHIPTVVLCATVAGFTAGIGSVEMYKKTTESSFISESRKEELLRIETSYDSLSRKSSQDIVSLKSEIKSLQLSLEKANQKLQNLNIGKKKTGNQPLDPTNPLTLRVDAQKNKETAIDVVGSQRVDGWYLSKRCATDAGGCKVDMGLTIVRQNGSTESRRQQGKFLLNSKTREWSFYIGDKLHREGLDVSGTNQFTENLIIFLAHHPFGECAFSDADVYNNEWYQSATDLDPGFYWQAINIGSQQDNIQCEITIL